MIDHLVMKMRMVRFIRTPDYDELFSGDPTWVTESIGGVGEDGRHLVTRSSFRVLHTLYNLGPAPEPNLTVLWSQDLPQGFKDFCAKVSIETSAIQYENDDLMRGYWGDDYGIACCVSAMRIGKQMQFFGARANLAKAMLYAINGGRDEISGKQIAPKSDAFTGEYLEYEDLVERFGRMQDWLAEVYVKALVNIIHYMHDRYCPEHIMMALHDREIYRTLACGIAGLSVTADALSAVKHARVRVIRNEAGLAVDYEVEGTYPRLRQQRRAGGCDRARPRAGLHGQAAPPAHLPQRCADPIRSPRSLRMWFTGRRPAPLRMVARRANPSPPVPIPCTAATARERWLPWPSVAKLPYGESQDGISYTFSIVPKALGRSEDDRVDNLCSLIDGYFAENGHHINVNVFDRETLLDAMDHPEKYPQLTLRVSGYAVNFIKLSREQQKDVIERTFHQLC